MKISHLLHRIIIIIALTGLPALSFAEPIPSTPKPTPTPTPSAISTTTSTSTGTPTTTPSFQEQTTPVANATSASPNQAPSIVPPPPALDAQGYVLMDANSGKVIAAMNADTRLAPASLTKLMTLYVAEQALANNEIHLADNVRISKLAWQTGGSRMFIKYNSDVSVQDLIQGIIVASGNDATVALAEFVGGSIPTFVNMMNTQAKRIGMSNTNFNDPTGLPSPQHYSTPYDLALLTRAIINDYPQYYSFFKEKWIDYNNIKQPNRNRLLWRDPSVDGLKTGHTDAAGYCLISSANRNGMRLISVVMGTPSDSARANESEALLNYGYRFYTTKKLFNANIPIQQQRVWLGENKYVNLGTSSDVYVTVPTAIANNVKITLTLNNKELKAPVIKGQQYATLNITTNNTTIEQVPVIALQNDMKEGFFNRMFGHLSLVFHSWFS